MVLRQAVEAGLIQTVNSTRNVGPSHHIVFAAADSPAWAQDIADYTCGSDDLHTQLSAAFTSFGVGGKATFLPGTYLWDGSVTLDDTHYGYVLEGAGGYGMHTQYLSEFDFQFIIPWAMLGIFIAVTVALSIFAAVIPARRASKIPPSDALRYTG